MARRLLLIVVASVLVAACGSATSTPPSAATPSSSVPGATAQAPGASVGSPAASVAPASPATSPTTGSDPASTGQAFIVALAQGNYAAAQAMEDSTMLAAAPADKLATIWQQFVAQFGTYARVGAATTTTQAPYTVVTVHTIFASGTVALNVAIDAAGKVAGLHVAAAPTPPSAVPSASPAA